MKRQRNRRTSPAPCSAVIAYRWGWINAHQYIVRVTCDLRAAKDAADAEAKYRGGKYGVTVWDANGKAVHHAPSIYGESMSHENYRTEMFASVGQHVVVGLEEGKPLTADEIVDVWMREVQTQQIMFRADPIA